MSDKAKKAGVVKTFLNYTIPCIIGLFFTSFIVVVDGIFIGWKIGETGLAAVNLTLPVLYIFLSVTVLIGVGGVTLSAQSLGAKQNDKANYYFSFSLFAIAIVEASIAAVIGLFPDEIVGLLGAKGIVQQYVKDFLGVLVYFYLFMMMNMAFSMFIRAEGKPQLALAFGLTGNILNIILDYMFIMRLDWGMKGAGLASGIAVLLPFLFGLCYFAAYRSAFRFCKFDISMDDLRNMLMNGAAECIAQISVSITTFMFNLVLLERMGVNGVAALTVIGYVLFIHNMIVTGIAVGIHPAISYQFGAKNLEVIFRLLALAVKVVFWIGFLLCMAACFFAEDIVGMFSRENGEFLRIGAQGLRWFSLAFALSGYNMIATAFFTSIGEAKTAALVSVLRSLILVVAFLMVLPYLFGDTGIWITLPLTEAVVFGVAYCRMNSFKGKLSFATENQ